MPLGDRMWRIRPAREPRSVILTGVINGPFRGSAAIRAGSLTWGRLRGPEFRRVLPDVYAPVSLRDDLAARSRAAHLLVCDRDGVLAGYSAALLLGADVAPLGAPAEVFVPHRHRSYPGLTVRCGSVRAEDLTEVDGCRVTSAVRTAWDLGRRLPLVESVVALDALCRAGRFAPESLLRRQESEPGARGARRLDRAVALADARAESPPETRLRLDLVRRGLPTPEVQYEIRDEYGFVLARADLAYPEAAVAIEYDGSVHFSRRRREADMHRDGVLAGYGWLTLRFGQYDVGTAQAAGRVRSVLATRTRAA